jgi:hypothetical protein
LGGGLLADWAQGVVNAALRERQLASTTATFRIQAFQRGLS